MRGVRVAFLVFLCCTSEFCSVSAANGVSVISDNPPPSTLASAVAAPTATVTSVDTSQMVHVLAQAMSSLRSLDDVTNTAIWSFTMLGLYLLVGWNMFATYSIIDGEDEKHAKIHKDSEIPAALQREITEYGIRLKEAGKVFDPHEDDSEVSALKSKLSREGFGDLSIHVSMTFSALEALLSWGLCFSGYVLAVTAGMDTLSAYITFMLVLNTIVVILVGAVVEFDPSLWWLSDKTENRHLEVPLLPGGIVTGNPVLSYVLRSGLISGAVMPVMFAVSSLFVKWGACGSDPNAIDVTCTLGISVATTVLGIVVTLPYYFLFGNVKHSYQRKASSSVFNSIQGGLLYYGFIASWICWSVLSRRFGPQATKVIPLSVGAASAIAIVVPFVFCAAVYFLQMWYRIELSIVLQRIIKDTVTRNEFDNSNLGSSVIRDLVGSSNVEKLGKKIILTPGSELRPEIKDQFLSLSVNELYHPKDEFGRKIMKAVLDADKACPGHPYVFDCDAMRKWFAFEGLPEFNRYLLIKREFVAKWLQWQEQDSESCRENLKSYHGDFSADEHLFLLAVLDALNFVIFDRIVKTRDHELGQESGLTKVLEDACPLAAARIALLKTMVEPDVILLQGLGAEEYTALSTEFEESEWLWHPAQTGAASVVLVRKAKQPDGSVLKIEKSGAGAFASATHAVSLQRDGESKLRFSSVDTASIAADAAAVVAALKDFDGPQVIGTDLSLAHGDIEAKLAELKPLDAALSLDAAKERHTHASGAICGKSPMQIDFAAAVSHSAYQKCPQPSLRGLVLAPPDLSDSTGMVVSKGINPVLIRTVNVGTKDSPAYWKVASWNSGPLRKPFEFWGSAFEDLQKMFDDVLNDHHVTSSSHRAAKKDTSTRKEVSQHSNST